jgi:deoxyribonuclease-4
MAADTPKQVPAAKAFIAESGLQYFTHAAYTINLCADHHGEDGNWAQRSLDEDLQVTVDMGGRGVIVHTGACKGRPLEEALNTMEKMVRCALQYATKYCPLLLETPCGEGTEVCTNIQDLGSFFFRFTPEEREKLGVCIDTAHIWGAGYDNPVDYFKHWEQYCQTPIGLVHFNDSRSQCGDRTDKHAPPGQGYIGMEKMLAVGAWCQARGIPMVHE